MLLKTTNKVGKTIVIKCSIGKQRNRSMEKNRREIDPYKSSQLNKIVKAIRKDNIFNKYCWNNWTFTCMCREKKRRGGRGRI